MDRISPAPALILYTDIILLYSRNSPEVPGDAAGRSLCIFDFYSNSNCRLELEFSGTCTYCEEVYVCSFDVTMTGHIDKLFSYK